MMEMINARRRKLLIAGSAVAACSLLPTKTWASVASSRPKALTLVHAHTGEKLKTEFFNGKVYDPSELARLNTLFRDFRRNEVTSIDPALFDYLYRLTLMVDARHPVVLLSGYRAPATNEMLRSKSNAVAKNSYHTHGQAMDLVIKGVELKNLQKAALRMKAGGVGYYPQNNFVHIDTGPFRHW